MVVRIETTTGDPLMHRSRCPALLVVLSLTLLAVAPPTAAGTVAVGEPLTVEETTPLADLAADADRYEGEMVRVEGRVTGVCRKQGCWLELVDDVGNGLRVKVEDGVIVFPVEAEGGHATVQGTVEILPMERDELVGWHRHLAEDAGRAFDESSVGPGPYRLVRLRGHGARLQTP